MSLAEALLDEYGGNIAELKLVPSSGGAFEVNLDGELVFSKKRQHHHPTIDQIKKLVSEKLEA